MIKNDELLDEYLRLIINNIFLLYKNKLLYYKHITKS